MPQGSLNIKERKISHYISSSNSMESHSQNEMSKIIEVASVRVKNMKKEYLVHWDSPPDFTWEPPHPYLESYIAQYERTMKGDLTDLPCLLKRGPFPDLTFSLNPQEDCTFYLGNCNAEEEHLSFKEKEWVLKELEELFYCDLLATDADK